MAISHVVCHLLHVGRMVCVLRPQMRSLFALFGLSTWCAVGVGIGPVQKVGSSGMHVGGREGISHRRAARGGGLMMRNTGAVATILLDLYETLGGISPTALG